MTLATQEMRRPRDLSVPDKVVEAFGHLSEYLTGEGQQEFISEMLQALSLAAKLDSMSPVHEVLETWYRTLLLKSQQDFDTEMSREDQEQPKLSVEEVRARLRP